jgi:uncharacterized protein YbjQ (UPF0145 family)
MPVPLPPSALARLQGAGPVFTAGVTVDELAALAEIGYTPVGVAMGTSMYHIGMHPQRWAQSVELGMLTQALQTARNLALSRLEAEAVAMNASGVIGVTLETVNHEGAGDVLEFLATGTAVRAADAPDLGSDATPFTTQLDAHELGMLGDAGYEPAAVVFGACVYHIAHQTLRQALAPNVELPQYSQAYYDGRELAMTRMQGRAVEVGATGVIGVEVLSSERVWRQHAIEFLAIGSGVRAKA